MKTVTLYNPAIASGNLGDQIIVDSIKKSLQHYLSDAYIIEMPTHTPLYSRLSHYLGTSDLNLICGSNLLVGHLNAFIHTRQWDLTLSTLHILKPAILIGVGTQKSSQKFNLYTKLAYKKILSHDYIHSVRDSRTERALRSIGIANVINTGCPTMWTLSEQHCKEIPEQKAEQVIFTLTDYEKNFQRDKFLLHTLKSEYKKIYFWAQGSRDYDYFISLKEKIGVNIISPNLSAYDDLLINQEIDYVGTRLHGGIRALQKKRRCIIIGLDNRSYELKKDFNLPVLMQDDISYLPQMINSKIATRIKIPDKHIAEFLSQFK